MRKYSGSLLHALGGALIAVLFHLVGQPLGLVEAFSFLGLLGLCRELRQMERSKDSGFGRHRLVEALAWGFGASAGAWSIDLLVAGERVCR